MVNLATKQGPLWITCFYRIHITISIDTDIIIGIIIIGIGIIAFIITTIIDIAIIIIAITVSVIAAIIFLTS